MACTKIIKKQPHDTLRKILNGNDMTLKHRRAKINDLREIVSLLADDILGQTREELNDEVIQNYVDAFHKIDKNPNHYLMVLERDEHILGTCHLTLMPSLTFMGSMRMQIESVRVRPSARRQNVGQKMIELAINWGKEKGAKIFQLTTHKERSDALKFYEKLGFKGTHEGMKLYSHDKKVPV